MPTTNRSAPPACALRASAAAICATVAWPERSVAIASSDPLIACGSKMSPFALKMPASAATKIGSLSPLTLLYATDIVVGAGDGVAVAATGGGDAGGGGGGSTAPPRATTSP